MNEIVDNERDGARLTRSHFLQSLPFPLLLGILLVFVQIFQDYSGFDPGYYGIMPRRMWALPGVLTGPLVHENWNHLFSNFFPIVTVTFTLLYFYRRIAMRVFWGIYFSTGAAVWLLTFREDTSHIGISGVLYGLVSFIFWVGVFRRSLRSIILAAIISMLYGSMFVGIFPDENRPNISWESHAWGFVMGIVFALIFRATLEDEERHEQRLGAISEPDEPAKAFLPQDIFEKTKTQRAQEAAEEAARRAREEEGGEWPMWWRNFS
ncbi:MAG: rhomboid family intramembrane serine protease [Chitinophagales bacterium]|nr:rhomboid family intramembrane serine protease [Chitinophagales bacterium]